MSARWFWLRAGLSIVKIKRFQLACVFNVERRGRFQPPFAAALRTEQLYPVRFEDKGDIILIVAVAEHFSVFD